MADLAAEAPPGPAHRRRQAAVRAGGGLHVLARAPKITAQIEMLNPSTVLPSNVCRLAEFLAPPDVYSLALTSPGFHFREPDGKVLATKALRVSLKRSLERVLRARGISLDALSFGALVDAETGRPGALIAGSTMVQCVLGTVWYGTEHDAIAEYPRGAYQIDVDVFTTAASAPAVRSHLCDHGLTLSCVQQDNTYTDNGTSLWGKALETNVHHTEGYSLTPADGAEVTWFKTFSLSKARAYAAPRKSEFGPPHTREHELEGPTWTLLGRAIQYEYLGESAGATSIIFPEVEAPEYGIRGAEANDSFNYDWDLEDSKIVDLVVAQVPRALGTSPASPDDAATSGRDFLAALGYDAVDWADLGAVIAATHDAMRKRGHVSDARVLLESFDITICKASFDGRVFRIPDPHLTFRAQSRFDPRRRELMTLYANYLLEGDEVDQEPDSPRDFGTWPVILKCAELMRTLGPKWDDTATLDTPQNEHGVKTFLHHNWFARLFKRIQKYRGRGIDIPDAPLEWDGLARHLKIYYSE